MPSVTSVTSVTSGADLLLIITLHHFAAAPSHPPRGHHTAQPQYTAIPRDIQHTARQSQVCHTVIFTKHFSKLCMLERDLPRKHL